MDQAYRDAMFIPSDSRTNAKQIIAKRSDLVQMDGGRLKPAGAGLVYTYEAGQVLGKITASGLYKNYDNAASDGSEVAVGVLAEQATVDEFGNGSEVSIIKGGAILLEDLLIGLDAAGKVDLNAKSSVEHGTNLIRF